MRKRAVRKLPRDIRRIGHGRNEQPRGNSTALRRKPPFAGRSRLAGTYTNSIPNQLIEYSLGDKAAKVEFVEVSGGGSVRVIFDAEETHSVEQQQVAGRLFLITSPATLKVGN